MRWWDMTRPGRISFPEPAKAECGHAGVFQAEGAAWVWAANARAPGVIGAVTNFTLLLSQFLLSWLSVCLSLSS
ncbi:hypothetical protein J6590_009196 [Homalodisca vitripennis]|nr:hypothetical protein J6590_009196 [Homalodisca vitripennis]